MESKILVGDAGGTKTDWCLIVRGKIMEQFTTSGFNMHTHSLERFMDEIAPQIRLLGKLSEVYLYCAGTASDVQNSEITYTLNSLFGCIPKIQNDLLGAARAMMRDRTGFIGIIGTGSNAGYYNGKAIQTLSESLGYILGDEGSGTYLGKKLLSGIYRGEFSKEFIDLFQQKYRLSSKKAIETIYRREKPNEYLSSFVSFLNEHRCRDEVVELVHHAFSDYFKVYFEKVRVDEPIHFVGAIAHIFSDILKQVAKKLDLPIGNIVGSPILGMAQYHAHTL